MEITKKSGVAADQHVGASRTGDPSDCASVHGQLTGHSAGGSWLNTLDNGPRAPNFLVLVTASGPSGIGNRSRSA